MVVKVEMVAKLLQVLLMVSLELLTQVEGVVVQALEILALHT